MLLQTGVRGVQGASPHSRRLRSSSTLAIATVCAMAKADSAGYRSTVVRRPGQTPQADDGTDPKAHHTKNFLGQTKFRNPHPSFVPYTPWHLYSTLIKGQVGLIEWPRPKPRQELVPVVKPRFLESRTSSSALRATWLGHACYYVEFASGLRVLFDPVFEDRCSPIGFLGFQRFTPPACDISELPAVDAVIISHSHYDHLSYPSLREIRRHFPNAHYFCGLGLKKWFVRGGFHNVTEMDWWDDAEVVFTPIAGWEDAEPTLTPVAEYGEPGTSSWGSSEPRGPITATISCLPSQHESGRNGWDQNASLWCSWAVSSGTPRRSVWFAGDTGYRTVGKVAEGADDYGDSSEDLPRCPQFRQIGERFRGFDLGLIGIGAYAPRELFSCVHSSPFDAVEIFKDTRCQKALANHWGTWVLSFEEVLEPPRLLNEALRRSGIADTGVFDVCDVGESREF